MATNNKDVVVVTPFSLSNDVEGNTVLNSSIDVEVNSDLTSLELGNDSLTILLADANNGGEVAEGLSQSTRQLTGDVVIDNDSSGSSSLGVGGLGGESAGSSRNKDDVALGLSREVSGLTSEVGSLDKRSRSLTSGGVGHDSSLDVITSNLEIGGTGRVQLSEGLLLDIVVVERLEGLVEVVDSGVVALATKDTGVAVGCGDVLKLLGISNQTLDADILLKLELVDQRLGLGGSGVDAGREGKDGEGEGCESHLGRALQTIREKRER